MADDVFVRVGRKIFGPMTPARFAEQRAKFPVGAEVARSDRGPWMAIRTQEERFAGLEPVEAPGQVSAPVATFSQPDGRRAVWILVATITAGTIVSIGVVLWFTSPVLLVALVFGAYALFALARAVAAAFFLVVACVASLKAWRMETDPEPARLRYSKAAACAAISTAILASLIVDTLVMIRVFGR